MAVGFRKTIALVCCVSVLLITNGSQAMCLSLGCGPTGGQDQSCCCTEAVVEDVSDSCCPSVFQQLADVQDESRQDSGDDQCSCAVVSSGSDASSSISILPDKPGGETAVPLATVLCSPVELHVGAGKIVFDDPLFPSTASGNLGTVVLTL